jgi:UDP-N-acetylglucosamine 2-epimerase
LVPHESVFASSDLYYKCLTTGHETPACDVAYLWGDLQRSIFTRRGFPEHRMHVMGTPKLDAYHNYQPLVDHDIFCRLLHLDPNKKIVMFATQLLDSQFASPAAARKAQNEAIKDMIRWCAENNAQCIIRTPPSKDNILFNSTKSTLKKHQCGIIDDARFYMLPPEEMVFHSDALLSFNSTMLFEATLANVPAIAMKYIEFEPLWGKLGIPIADSYESLAPALTVAMERKKALATAEGMQWAARQFSNDTLDGQAATRIVQAIQHL